MCLLVDAPDFIKYNLYQELPNPCALFLSRKKQRGKVVIQVVHVQ